MINLNYRLAGGAAAIMSALALCACTTVSRDSDMASITAGLRPAFVLGATLRPPPPSPPRDYAGVAYVEQIDMGTVLRIALAAKAAARQPAPASQATTPPSPLAAVVAPTPLAIAVQPPLVAPRRKRTYVAQIGALPNAAAATAEWNRALRRAHRVLASQTVSVEESDHGRRGRFQLIIKAFDDKLSAKSFCGMLQMRRIDCLVKKRFLQV